MFVLKVTLMLLAAVSLSSAKPTVFHPQDHAWLVKRDINDEATTLPPPTTFEPEEENKETVTEASKKNSPPEIYSMRIKSNIRLRYATTRVTSRVVNPASKSQETVFHIVLPENAFISAFVMEINGTSYTAQVKEKVQAQNEYDAAVSQGQSAAQVSTSARDANQFTVSVNIEPAAKVTFNLTYDELLTRRRGIYEHQIHINPGRIIADFGIDVDISEVLPITDIRVPELRNDIQKIEDDKSINDLAVISRINATNAAIKYTPTKEQQKKISLDGLQGQFLVQYDVDRSSVEKNGGEIHIIDGYFVHFFSPSSLPSLPKHVVFVLDTSGSMQGIKLEQTKQAMESILDQLRPDDLFSVIEFSSKAKEWNLSQPYSPPDWIYDPPKAEKVQLANNSVDEPFGSYDEILAYPVTKAALDRAKLFTSSMRAAGGTNINEALLKALNNSQSIQSLTRLTPMIIFLTDGDPSVGVTSTDVIVGNIKKANADGIVSIYSLAFGTEADFTFLKKISSQNKAFARKIYEASDATLQLKGFFSEVASPVLANVQFNYEGTVANITETKIGNFFNGSEIVVAGQVNDSSAAAANLRAIISGLGADGLTYQNIWDGIEKSAENVPVSKQNDGSRQSDGSKLPSKLNFSLEKTWAYLTIKNLLRKSEAEDKTLYKDEALKLSLKYKFVTPVTSLLVIKPNQTATQTDLKSADTPESGTVGLSTKGALPLFFARPIHFSHSGPTRFPSSPPIAQLATAFFSAPSVASASPTFFGGQLVAAVPLDEEAAGDVPVPESIEVEDAPAENAETDVPSTTSVPQLVHDFLEGYDQNSTHVTLSVDGVIRSLSWEDDLPDKEFQSCQATYARQSSKAFCKSIWKCAAVKSKPVVEDFCVIENSHIGVCCALEDSEDDSAALAPLAEPLPAVPTLDAASIPTISQILTAPAKDI